jgi:Ca2+/Na+ antiporter
MPLSTSPPDIAFLFAGAGLVLYAGSRAAVDALTVTNDPTPGRMALAQWMPIAWSALLATAAGHSEIGVGLVFATSVAALALNLGVLMMLIPRLESPPPTARAWPFLLPAALVPLLAGFRASLNWLHALMMLALGVAILVVWKAPRAVGDIPTATETRPRRVRALQLLIAILLGAVGAWLGYQAVMAADAKTRVATSGLISAAILSPLLALPMLGTGAIAGNNGRTDAVMSNLVGVVLLNLCVLLPLVIFCDYARQIILAWTGGAHELAGILEQLRPVPFPLGVWRIDNVLLVVLGMMMIPVSLGKWTLDRGEGVSLAFGYIAYLIASATTVVKL